ncbi:DUF389 domain-containing protein [Rhodococcus sp. SGAir0479]|uniref:DUF389 domain-containing protein n=1 Tax=Rhodococcus sp. SGAir0479 TaxID=2567884 RepID=UPI0010CCEC1C|nr:DUF389 domain-containing protein [Rhodococcus sp. SGAir0479]QCQ90914.1 DUF389 domain-containing protein [Rhodococcus sp. SGAir0479]
MLHLRVICPEEDTDEILALLEEEPGATHITVARGSAVEPAGDVVQADIARESANEVLDQLHELRIEFRGAITLVPIETVLSEAARGAERAAPGDPDDSVVWEELISRTREESTLNVTFLAFLTIACLLASVGIVTDSPVTIVGAMVVGPEFGPLAALAVAVARRKFSLARRSLLALVIGFPFAIVVAAVATLVAKLLGWVGLDTIEDLHQVDFIYRVGLSSFIVALLAGAAGMLALVSAKSAALVGVFISVTTVPAAGFTAVAATLGDWRVALMSALQLGVNLTGIVIAAIAVLLLQRTHEARDRAATRRLRRSSAPTRRR